MNNKDFEEIKNNLNGLLILVERLKTEEPSEDTKSYLSKQLAFTVACVRYGYKLTSKYYAPAEISAEALYDDLHSDKNIFE